MKKKNKLTKKQELDIFNFLYADFLKNREEYELLKGQLDELKRHLKIPNF